MTLIKQGHAKLIYEYEYEKYDAWSRGRILKQGAVWVSHKC